MKNLIKFTRIVSKQWGLSEYEQAEMKKLVRYILEGNSTFYKDIDNLRIIPAVKNHFGIVNWIWEVQKGMENPKYTPVAPKLGGLAVVEAFKTRNGNYLFSCEGRYFYAIQHNHPTGTWYSHLREATISEFENAKTWGVKPIRIKIEKLNFGI